jgi:hypothetical protein
MVFIPDHIPPTDQSLDSETRYVADVPFDYKQAEITTRRHRWFQVQDIGTPGALYVTTPGLNAGATQRIQFDHKPDWIIVSIGGQTALTGRCILYLGDSGGPFVRLGPHGKVTIPAPEGGIITLTNVGSTATFGTVVAIAGYVDPGVDVICGD